MVNDAGSSEDDWLEDYEDGSTSEEVLDRVKRGMQIWDSDADAEEIARGTVGGAMDRAEDRRA